MSEVQRDANTYRVIVEPTGIGFQSVYIRRLNPSVVLRFVTQDGKELEKRVVCPRYGRDRTMRTVFDPFSFLVTCIAGWMNQYQHDVINYLLAENRVLREQIGIADCGSTMTSGDAWP